MTQTDAATGGTTTTTPKPSTSGARIAYVIAAAVATAVVWFVARAVFDVEIAARTGSTETTVELPAVIIATLVSGALGWGLLALLESKTGQPRKAWLISAVAIFLVSLLAGPLGGLTAGAKLTLGTLHAAAAAVLIPGFARTVPANRES